MSALSRLFRIVGLYFLAAGLSGLLAALVWPWDSPVASDDATLKRLATALVVLPAAVLLGLAVAGLAQAIPLLHYRGRPEALLGRLTGDLDSPNGWKRRLALQVLADHHGQPFGLVFCWPIPLLGAVQVRNMALLYKEWLLICGRATREGLAAPLLPQHMRTPAKAAVWDTVCVARPWGLRAPSPEWKYPPVPAEQLVAAMRGRVEQALRQVADGLTEAQPGRLAATEAHVRDVLVDLFFDVLDSALTIGMAADVAARTKGPDTIRQAGLLASSTPAEMMDRAADVIKDVLLDAGTDGGDEPAPYRQPLPTLRLDRFADALREPVAQTLAAVAERVNAAPDLEGVAACVDEIRELFEALAGHALELAAGLRLDAAAERLPWPAARGEWVKKFRRMAVMKGLPATEDRHGPTA